MTRARKTVEIRQVLDIGNGMLKNSHDSADRIGVCSFLSAILMETGNYRGFRYLASTEDVQAGNYDETRRQYYYPESV